MSGKVKMTEWFKKRIMGYPSEDGVPPDRPKARRVNPDTGNRVSGYLLNDTDLRVRQIVVKVVDHGEGRFGVRFHLANKAGKEIRELGEANVFPTDDLKIADLDHALFVYCS